MGMPIPNSYNTLNHKLHHGFEIPTTPKFSKFGQDEYLISESPANQNSIPNSIIRQY